MKIVVYLVHGTFRPDAEWIQPDSQLARSICSVFDGEVTIRQFKWDGSNRYSSRSKAASSLAEQLDQVAATRDFERIILVAHSHGGNIAFNAVANMRNNAKVTAMVSLGTPYIRMELKIWAPPVLFALTLSFWLGLISALLFANILAASVGLFIFPFLLRKLKIARDELSDLSMLKPSLGGAGVLPILCVRHGCDEASLWLGLLSITRASENLLCSIGKKFSGSFWASLFKFWLFGFGLSALFAFTINFGMVGLFILTYLTVIFTLPVLSTIGAIFTSHRWGFGGRPNLKSLFLHPHLTAKPHCGEIHEAKFSGLLGIIRASSFTPLRLVTPHSLGYSDPKAIKKVSTWLKAVCIG